MAELPEEEELPGSEASLGLQGMLITRGCEANAAQAMVHGLRVHPEQFLAPLLANLPELAPDEPPTLRQRLSLATLPWLAITLIGCELIGRMPSHLGTALVLLLMAATGWKIQRRILLLLLISWSASFALARLAHWL